MSENDYKKTYNGFTKFVLWGTLAVIAIRFSILWFSEIDDKFIKINI